MDYFDIVDKKDNVIGQVEYDEIYQENHIHRIVHVMVFDSEERMALQLRSKDKDFCPEHWSTAVAGYVQSGENFKEAATREMEDRLGISEDIDFLDKNFYQNCPHDGPSKFLGVFKAEYEGEFDQNLSEMEKVEYFTLDEIENMVNNGEKFHPELLFLLKNHFDIEA